MSTGSSWLSILTDMVKGSFNLPYQTLSGLSTNSSTPRRASEDEVFTIVSMVCHVGERPALETLVPIVYRVADLQRPEHANVSLTLHRGANLKISILISTHYYVLLHISTTYYYHEASQQARDVHRQQHGVYVQTTTI